MKEKVFTFRIVEYTHKNLEVDNKTISEYVTYKVYEKVPWYISFSGWQEVCVDFQYEFDTIEEAYAVARRVVYNWERDYALTEHSKGLKTTTKIIREFDMKPFE